jgi:hypothetical protein
MRLRSQVFLWAALLVGVDAAFRNVSYGGSSPQVQLLPVGAWTFVDQQGSGIAQYAFTDVEGAKAVFTFPGTYRLCQHALIGRQTR